MADSSCWLAFGDIHDDISRLEQIPELDEALGVIITGDLTFAGGVLEAKSIVEPIAERVPCLLAQIGNMDRDEITDALERKGWNLHAKAVEIFPGVVVMGLGASPPTPFGTPSEFPESRLAAWLEEAHAEAQKLLNARNCAQPTLILVAHTPPHSTACDRLTSGAPAGSTAVRAFIEQHQPDFCLCGHIHEARGEDAIGKTRIINPGTLPAGGYVVLRISEGPAVSAELKILP